MYSVYDIIKLESITGRIPMNVTEWLLNGNPNISYLVNRSLLNCECSQKNEGYIGRYLSLYNKDTKMWGNGLYGPKWVSSTYTLLDLINLNASVDQRMCEAFKKLREEIVLKYTLNPEDHRTLDLCIVGMLLRIGSYIGTDNDTQKELIDFVLHTINFDGAWNCYYNYRKYQTSSLHTTINVLEGLNEYVSKGYTYREKEIKTSINSAIEFILKKNLFRSRRTNEIIYEPFTKVHFPTRWFYDMFRALELFIELHVPFDERMSEGLDIIKDMLKKGPLPKGKAYAGKLHFKYDLEDYKRINTLRALRIIKFYDYEFYTRIYKKQSFKK